MKFRMLDKWGSDNNNIALAKLCYCNWACTHTEFGHNLADAGRRGLFWTNSVLSYAELHLAENLVQRVKQLRILFLLSDYYSLGTTVHIYVHDVIILIF